MSQSPAQRFGIDIDYLRRCKSSTPEQRLDWLAAAQEFAHASRKPRTSWQAIRGWFRPAR